jgi:glycosyltransferase involved in cell wall biosynthesis
MRVLLIADSLTPTYGWGRYAIGLIRALRRQGVDFTLLTPKRRCTAADLAALPDHGEVTSFVSETRRLSRLVVANALPIRRALAGCDLVHCITEPYAVPAALVAGRKPLVVTLHGTYAVRPFTRWAERPWYEVAYRRASRLLPVSSFTRALLPTRFKTAKTQVVPEGVDLEHFRLPSAPPGRLPPSPGAASAEPPFLLSVGPIKRRKGYHRTIEAFARVHAARPDVRYRIVGGTDDRVFLGELEGRIAALGLGDAVDFLGRVPEDDLVRLYHTCAAMWLLPVVDGLQFEAFGLVYWEANACGRPVIGSRGSGAEVAIADGMNGYLVPADDPAAAAAAALRLVNDPSLAARLGAAGRERVRPWDDAARLVQVHYQSLLGLPRPASEPVWGGGAGGAEAGPAGQAGAR